MPNPYISQAVRKARKVFTYFDKSFISAAERRALAAKGHALEDGSYPIRNTSDLAHAATLAQSGHGNVAGAKRLIARRAKELGVENPLAKRLVLFEKESHASIERRLASGELSPLQANAEHMKTIAARRRNAVQKAYEIDIEILKDEEIAKKLDLKDGLLWGWASIIEKDGKPVIDHQGDVIGEDDLMKAAHDHVTNSRIGGALHLYVPGPDKTPLKGGDVVESMVFTKALQKALGIDLGKVGWLIGYRITDPYVKKMAASGHLKSFSIGGTGRREPLDG